MAEINKKTVRKTEKTVETNKSKLSSKSNLIKQSKFDEYVQQRAYYIWEEMGKPQGEDMGIWIRAEQDIKAQFSTK